MVVLLMTPAGCAMLHDTHTLLQCGQATLPITYICDLSIDAMFGKVIQTLIYPPRWELYPPRRLHACCAVQVRAWCVVQMIQELQARPLKVAGSTCSSNHGMLKQLKSWAEDIKDIEVFRRVRHQLQGGVHVGKGEKLTEAQVQLLDMAVFVAHGAEMKKQGMAVHVLHVAVLNEHKVDFMASIERREWWIEYKLGAGPKSLRQGLLRCLEPHHKAISAEDWEYAVKNSPACTAAELEDVAVLLTSGREHTRGYRKLCHASNCAASSMCHVHSMHVSRKPHGAPTHGVHKCAPCFFTG